MIRAAIVPMYNDEIVASLRNVCSVQFAVSFVLGFHCVADAAKACGRYSNSNSG